MFHLHWSSFSSLAGKATVSRIIGLPSTVTIAFFIYILLASVHLCLVINTRIVTNLDLIVAHASDVENADAATVITDKNFFDAADDYVFGMI